MLERNLSLDGLRPSRPISLYVLVPRFCTSLIEAGVGEKWQSRDPMGRSVQNVLVAGRVP